MRSRAKEVSLCAVFTALALIVGYLEHMLPLPIAAPGVKLGLANVVTVTAMYVLGLRAAFAISMARVLLSGLLFSGMGAMMYALCGALASFAGMALIKRCRAFSIMGVSVAGALLHNAAQYALAAAIARTAGLITYLPVLALAASATGVIVGWVAWTLTRRLTALGFARGGK